MLKYRIFFIGVTGTLWDAFTSGSIPYGLNYDCIDDAVYDLANWKIEGKINPDLTFVFLPIYSE